MLSRRSPSSGSSGTQLVVHAGILEACSRTSASARFSAWREPSSSRSSAARSASAQTLRRVVAPVVLPRRRHRRRSPASTRVPANDGARIVSIVLVLAGLTIIAYAGAVIVEAIAGGVFTGVLAERRRGADDRALARPLHHLRLRPRRPAGRRGVPRGRRAVRRARLPRGRARPRRRSTATSCIEGNATEDEDLAARRPRARARARRRVGRRRRQPLHLALGASRAARPADRRARVRRRTPSGSSCSPAPTASCMPYTAAGRTMANLVLKPQVTVVPRRGDDGHRARPPCRGDRGGRDVRARRQDDPRAPRPRTRPARSSSRCASATERSTRRRSPTRVIEVGRRARSASARPTSCSALEDLFAPRRGRCRADPVIALAASSRRRPARRSSSSARATPSTATTRRTSRCSSPARGGRRRASSRRSSPEAARDSRRSSAPRSPGPGFVNLFLADAWLATALGEMLDDGLRRRARQPQPRQRVQVEMVSANPTGPITVASARNGAYGDSVARLLEFAGHDVEREYYYNDAGAQMDRFRASVEAVRRGEEPPEDGYHGDYVARARARRRRSRRRDARADRGRRSSASASTSTRGRTQSDVEKRVAGAAAAASTRTRRDGTLWARTTALRRRQGPAAHPLVRRLVPLLRRRHRVRARQARARLRHGDLRPRRRPPRLRRAG